MHLPCSRSHANASKLDVTFVDQCFTQCLLARKEERRKRKKREEKERKTRQKKERTRKKEREKEKEEN